MNDIYRPMLYTMLDGVAMNKEYPDTFQMPSYEDRLNVEKGDGIQIGFDATQSDILSTPERMWVTVEGKIGNVYAGILDNEPATIECLKLGDQVFFKLRNIIKIIKKEYRINE